MPARLRLPSFADRLLHVLACLAFALVAACARIESPQREGMLVAAALPEPNAIDPDSPSRPDTRQHAAFTHDFLEAFAEQLGVPLRMVAVDDPDHLRQLLQTQRVHLGGFVDARPAIEGVLMTRPLTGFAMRIAHRDDRPSPASLADLAGQEVHALVGSAAAAALAELPAAERPRLVAHGGMTAQGMLARVASGEFGYAACDELNLTVAANFQPELQAGPALFGQRDIALAVPDTGDTALRDALDDFIAESRANGTLQRLYDRHYGHVTRIGPELAARFLADVQTVLPRYRADFEHAQDRTGLDWRLLAALAYQESKWNPLATSPTNVRGIMMLTEDTADALNVDNRLDAAQSIRAGADYLRQLIDQLPPSVPLPDRLWFGLAAYNLGAGHLNGGRGIGLRLNKDVDSWYDMKSVLPLMARPEYFARLKSGRARGGEAVILVENVRNLYGILQRLEPARDAPFARMSARATSAAQTDQAALRRSAPPR